MIRCEIKDGIKKMLDQGMSRDIQHLKSYIHGLFLQFTIVIVLSQFGAGITPCRAPLRE